MQSQLCAGLLLRQRGSDSLPKVPITAFRPVLPERILGALPFRSAHAIQGVKPWGMDPPCFTADVIGMTPTSLRGRANPAIFIARDNTIGLSP